MLTNEMVGSGTSAGSAKGIAGLSNPSVIAAGSTQTDATAIAASVNFVTGANGTTGVRLPAVTHGFVTIFNSSGSTLKVYPPSGAAIAVPGSGNGSADAAYSQTTYSTCTYTVVSSTQWLVNKSA